MNQAFYDMLLAHVSEAARLARWIFTAIVVVSLIMVITAYGFAWGAKRTYVEDLVLRDGLPRKLAPGVAEELARRPTTGVGAEALKDLRQAMVESWVEEQAFEIDLLGVKLDAGEAGLLGGVTLVSLCWWLLFAARREHRLVAQTLDFAGREPPALRAYVFHALDSSRLFATLREERPGPQASADAPPVERATPARPLEAAARGLARRVLYLPALALTLVIVVDLLSVFRLPAVFRGYAGTLWEMRREITSVFVTGTLIEAIALLLVCVTIIAIDRVQDGTCARLDAGRRAGWGELPAPPAGAA